MVTIRRASSSLCHDPVPRATSPLRFSEEELVDCIGWDHDQFTYFSPKGFMTVSKQGLW